MPTVEQRPSWRHSIQGGSPEGNPISKFELQPTHIKGVSLKVEKGKKVNITGKIIRQLYNAANEFAPADFREKEAGKQRADERLSIIEIAKKFKNLRGIVSQNDGWEVTITRSVSKEWVQEVLQESLGILYGSFTREDYEASINVPQGTLTKDGELIDSAKVASAVREALSGLDLSDEDIGAIMTDKVLVRLDEDALNKAIKEKRVKVPKKATKEETTITASASKLKPS